MKKTFKFLGSMFALTFLPLVAFAQLSTTGGVFGDEVSSGSAFEVMNTIFNILNGLIVLLIIVASVYFIWGVVKFLIAKGGEDKEEGKNIIKNGLIGLFIIVAFWGIIRIVQNTFGLNSSNQIEQQDIPCIQGINCPS